MKPNEEDNEENIPELPEELNMAIDEYTNLNNVLLEKNYQMQFEYSTDYAALYVLGQEILSLSKARNALLQRIIIMISRLMDKPDNGDTPFGDKKFFRF